jgi:hypothetical protein
MVGYTWKLPPGLAPARQPPSATTHGLARARCKVSVDVLENGLPMFLTELAERLSAGERVVSMVHRPVRCEADSSTCADQV